MPHLASCIFALHYRLLHVDSVSAVAVVSNLSDSNKVDFSEYTCEEYITCGTLNRNVKTILCCVSEMAPKTKPEAKPKADKSKKEKPAPKKVESKKDTKDAKAPAKAVQKALKVSLGI